MMDQLKISSYKEVEELKNKIFKLEERLNNDKFLVEQFKDDPKLFMFYTGFKNYRLFKTFLDIWAQQLIT